ncbi:glycosyl transferase family protein [Gynuella sunshinyii]|uniref:Anthranilate phosphoribosyltransferase n=1 Tax=Gynuella sunshinyii YC6258 TaxID=1445510 RepID=A0A0C5VZF5_9GAMM|nr:glycosyl transferase family protein [Gynuella sunshinyii]AJQ95789.1 anthranilate phosphoribosyltransferase [Gynuella sunshinyii YC6258]
MNKHPFAEFIRILGRGKNGSRSLTREEARDAFSMVLENTIEDVQLGAFLMLLRVKEETGEEIAGFVDASKQHINAPQHLHADIDWGCYAGKRRHNPWFVLSALALSQAGYKVFMHGAQGHTAGRVYAEDTFMELGLPIANNWQQVETAMTQQNIVYFPIAHLCPRLHDLIELRPLLGLRSPVHTLARLLNPLNSSAVVQGIFHPAYNGIHQRAACQLGYKSTLIIRGEGGEFERNPESKLTLFRVMDGLESTLDMDMVLKQRQVKPESLDLTYMKSIWHGTHNDIYAEAAITATLQLALMAMATDMSPEQASQKAQEIWLNRNPETLQP